MRISIIMANYNNSEYIETAIQSVANQTYSNWELIIIDDASTDNSLEKIKAYLTDKRIKLVVHDKNLGYSATQKTGVEKSTGEIIGILDADDALRPDALEKISAAYLKNSDCGLIYSAHYICDNNLKIIGIGDWVGDLPENKTNIKVCMVSAFRTFSRDAYQKTAGFNPQQKRAVDRDIIYKLEEVTKLKFIDETLYYYRQNANGISQGSKEEAHFYDLLAIVEAYKRRKKTDLPNLSSQEIIEKLIRTIKHSLSLRNYQWSLIFIKILFGKDVFSFADFFTVLGRVSKIKINKNS